MQASPECRAALADGQEHFLGVWAEARITVAFDVDHERMGSLGAEDSLKRALTATPARITFPGGEDPEQFLGMVVECNFDPEEHAWCFMRDRAKCVPAKILLNCPIFQLYLCAPCQLTDEDTSAASLDTNSTSTVSLLHPSPVFLFHRYAMLVWYMSTGWLYIPVWWLSGTAVI